RAQPGPEECDQPGAEPAGRSSPRQVSDVDGEVAIDDRGEMTKGVIQPSDLLGGGALLRSVHGRRTPGADQRVVDIAGDDELRGGDRRVEPTHVDASQVAQRRAPGAEVVSS